MWMKWFPWQYMIRKAARAEGFLDPFKILTHFNRFGQPAEVMAPTELLRAGFVMHARGLVNSQAIQHNLDWVWPYWVEQQFNPHSASFVPRAFSFTHINITHRNWTAVGVPGCPSLAIVDPRGLVTPFYDGWSIDSWFISDNGEEIVPSRMDNVAQHLDIDNRVRVVTTAEAGNCKLETATEMQLRDSVPECTLRLHGGGKESGWLVVSIRPFNPEGVSFIHKIELADDSKSCLVDGKRSVAWHESADDFRVSQYGHGDVYYRIRDIGEKGGGRKVSCKTGMATAAAMFRVKAGAARDVHVSIDLSHEPEVRDAKKKTMLTPSSSWSAALRGTCDVTMDNSKYQGLFQTAMRTLILHASDDLYAGPYTYRRFWFRDAALIVHTMITCGMTETARKVIDSFLPRQTPTGHFLSQEGEWDSNGQVLWVMGRFCDITNTTPSSDWIHSIRKAAAWILKKRVNEKSNEEHAGLLPPGFSAEHLGPNDYYYWDNFWAVAGLRKAAELLKRAGHQDEGRLFLEKANAYLMNIDRSLTAVTFRIGSLAMPASPYRRLDSGAVGSLCAGFPLQLWAGDDPRLVQTAVYLYDHCLVKDALFHDISHSGINPYLTLHLAQVLLRAGDGRFSVLMNGIAELASPTGHWPEAIHPVTGAGCMGDGQHVWAAAEWINMLYRCFVDEEPKDQKLVLCRGVDAEWYKSSNGARFGPAHTSFGTVTVTARREGRAVMVGWDADWSSQPSVIEVALPGYKHMLISPQGQREVRLSRKEKTA